MLILPPPVSGALGVIGLSGRVCLRNDYSPDC